MPNRAWPTALDVIAEYPQEPEITQEMQPARVQEHVRDQRRPVRVPGDDAVETGADADVGAGRDGVEQFARHQTVKTYGTRDVGAGALHAQPRHEVQQDDRDDHERSHAAGVVVPDGDHRGTSE